MLSLFKDPEVPVMQQEALVRARELLISFLNKGLVPEWEQFFVDLPLLQSAEDLEAVKLYFETLTEWEFLKDILSGPATEYFFHSTKNCQRLTLNGKKISFDLPLPPEDWQLWLEILTIRYKQNWNIEHPFCSFYGELFGKNYRFSIVHESTSPHKRSKLVLRCLSIQSHPIEAFGEAIGLLELVQSKKNILIAGSTGSGKTSFLTTLLDQISAEEHLVVLEDTFEILSSHPHQTRFLAGKSMETSLKAYVTYSLRLSPDRIILGEMRSHEVVPFLMAMNTGHKGLMGTLHASSAADALNRVALLFSLYSGEANLSFEKVMELICRNLEYVVFMENKKVKEVIKLLGSEHGIPFYESIIPPHTSRQDVQAGW